jgi:hypothetical protein
MARYSGTPLRRKLGLGEATASPLNPALLAVLLCREGGGMIRP